MKKPSIFYKNNKNNPNGQHSKKIKAPFEGALIFYFIFGCYADSTPVQQWSADCFSFAAHSFAASVSLVAVAAEAGWSGASESEAAASAEADSEPVSKQEEEPYDLERLVLEQGDPEPDAVPVQERGEAERLQVSGALHGEVGQVAVVQRGEEVVELPAPGVLLLSDLRLQVPDLRARKHQEMYRICGRCNCITSAFLLRMHRSIF